MANSLKEVQALYAYIEKVAEKTSEKILKKS